MPSFDLDRIRAGDHDTFDRLFDQYAPRVMGYVLRMTGDRPDAEDLVQEVFLAAYAGRESLRGDSQPLAWLLGIARRRWRDTNRRQSPATVPLEGEPGKAVARGRDLAEDVVEAAAIEAALGQLELDEREVLVLTAVEGLTYSEAAQVLGVPAGTLKWRVHQAVRKLRHVFDTGGDDDEDRREVQSGGGREAHAPCGR